MLMNSDINPFDSQDAKPYKNDPEILAMTNLVSAYMRNEIREFEKLLKQNSRTVMGDAFIRDYIEDLLKNIRTQVRPSRSVDPLWYTGAVSWFSIHYSQVLLKVITPYTRIRISFIAQELNITPSEVEQLLVALILDGQVIAAGSPLLHTTLRHPVLLPIQVDGHIDQLDQLLLLNEKSGDAKKYQAVDKWGRQLAQLQQTVFTKLN